MLLNNEKLFNEFYKKIKEDYPNIEKDDLKTICFYPWRYLRDRIGEGVTRSVRFEYFGVFFIDRDNIKRGLKKLEKRKGKKNINMEVYERTKKYLKKYL